MMAEVSKLNSILTSYNLKSKIKTIYDVGLGDASELSDLHSILPEAFIHAFEPNPFSTVSVPVYCKLYKVAVSNQNSKLKFHAGKNSTLLQGSLYEPLENAIHISKADGFSIVNVDCISLDDFIKQGNKKPDLLWIDTQGSEFNILLGLGEFLYGVSVLHIELFMHEEYKSTPLFDEVDYFLKDKFRLVSGSPVEGTFDNFIFVNKKVLN